MIDKILTIDLEYDFESKEDKSLKVIVPKLLDYFSENNITATFFVIGEIAEKYPKLVKKISKSHEVASHGYDHSYINENSLDYQLRKSKLAIEKLGIKCKGFRAPYFMYPNTLYKSLKENGYKYDSSISSFFPGRYNNLLVNIKPHWRNGIIELPMSNFVGKFLSSGLPYYRLFYPASKLFKLPYMFYLHPCEFLSKRPHNQINWLVKKLYSRNQGKKAWKMFTSMVENSNANWISCDEFIKKWII
ncbi:polysaccharide deacetylase family protein [Candidatus Woesearchaeota archaeon]|nr:polysaccharide deacetylase family protein [Candidatus Woesearchaeota archaeon]